MKLAVIRKATAAVKTFAALLTLEGFRSGVGVHVRVSALFRSEHLLRQKSHLNSGGI